MKTDFHGAAFGRNQNDKGYKKIFIKDLNRRVRKGRREKNISSAFLGDLRGLLTYMQPRKTC